MSGHPLHGIKPLARKLRVEAKWCCPQSGDDVQLYKVRVTVKIQGAAAARSMAEKIQSTTGAAPIISRL